MLYPARTLAHTEVWRIERKAVLQSHSQALQPLSVLVGDVDPVAQLSVAYGRKDPLYRHLYGASTPVEAACVLLPHISFSHHVVHSLHHPAHGHAHRYGYPAAIKAEIFCVAVALVTHDPGDDSGDSGP